MDVVPGVYQAEIDLSTGKILTERKLIWEGTGGSFPEGPHLYNIDNRYYLVIAEGGTEYGHMVTVARSDQPYGPFEACPYNPVLSHRSISHPVQATGHVDFVQAHDGTWWTVLLGIRPIGYPFHHHLGRETYLAPVTWTEDGWPLIGENGRVDIEMEGPAFSKSIIQRYPASDVMISTVTSWASSGTFIRTRVNTAARLLNGKAV